MNKQQRLPFFGLTKITPFLRPYRKTIVRMLILGAFTTGIDALYPLFNRYALNHFAGEGTLAGLGWFILLYVGVLTVQTAINYRSTYDCGQLEMWTNRDLRSAAFSHLQTLSFSYYNQNSVGYIHARVISDCGQIGEAVSWRVMSMVWDGALLLGILTVMLVIDRGLALMILALIPFAAVLMALFQRRILSDQRSIREMNSRITGDFNEGITGLTAIKVLGIERKMNRGFASDARKMERFSVRAGRFSSLFISAVTLLSSLTLALVLWQGGRLTAEGLMTIGTLSVFMSYALQMLEPVQNIVVTVSAMTAIQASIERLTGLLEEKPDVADSPEVMERYGDSFTPKKENWEVLRGDVEFEDVTFRYPDGGENVLEHFSLKVPYGTNVAIVGETGAGKSTLVNLVCRFFEPVEGRLLIDGRDARERSQLWLHSHIGYVLQTPHLFSGTIRENLRYGREDATDEEMMEALRMVSADKLVSSMEKGLDSEVGEGGALLSTGEKQLISFARALLADPRILILDEATASIDTVTEKAIQKAIQTVIRGRTSFVVAHRLSTIVDADVILVVRDGKIVDRGTHRELLAHGGYYRELYRRQVQEAEAFG